MATRRRKTVRGSPKDPSAPPKIQDLGRQIHRLPRLIKGEGDYAGANLEDSDECEAENVFWGPAKARWSHLQASAKQRTIGKIMNDAMVAIERYSPRLKGVLRTQPIVSAGHGVGRHRLRHCLRHKQPHLRNSFRWQSTQTRFRSVCQRSIRGQLWNQVRTGSIGWMSIQEQA